MKKELEICDWCEKEEASVVIVKGENQGDCLCDNCQDYFLKTILANEYLNKI